LSVRVRGRSGERKRKERLVIFLVAIVGFLVRPMVVRSGAVLVAPLRAALIYSWG
jgi:hypothetical protein